MAHGTGKNWYWNMFDLFLIGNAALEILIPAAGLQVTLATVSRYPDPSASGRQ